MTKFKRIEIPGEQIYTTSGIIPRKYKDIWQTAFVYSPKGNFMLVGWSHQVEKYIKSNFQMCFYRYDFWQNGVTRGDWLFHFEKYERMNGKIRRVRNGNRKYYSITITRYNKVIYQKMLRSLPKKWLNEFMLG